MMFKAADHETLRRFLSALEIPSVGAHFFLVVTVPVVANITGCLDSGIEAKVIGPVE
ncbi:hypothetical protein OCEANICA350_20092 [Oceanicaulis sp. 350]|nr:hypothetical protein OCEANICA350_20092 [Oceanicaulis sp. 350]